ncbi:hypothetical protein DXG03_000627 [Asterophora parasitica]|uniref:Uncharacterized protein n=1 Tax=Asterophora parasitica TaxID=117018 RepID=A0A9P7FY24_9AGAR|nr:hypothetical protein DXG03_000627 [Asterophora parasitica]
MAHFNSSRVLSPYSYDQVHCDPIFQHSGLASSPSDLSGFDCTIGQDDIYTEGHHYSPYHVQPGSVHTIEFPPSPPPTNSDPKRSVPLPTISSSGLDAGPSSPPRDFHFGGLLELAPESDMKHVALGLHAPLTPPPTLPTPTQPLPPTDLDLPLSFPQGDSQSSLLSLPEPEEDEGLEIDAPHRLFSRLSPEWNRDELGLPPSLPYATGASAMLYRSYDGTNLFTRNTDTRTHTHIPLQSRPILPLLDIPDLHFSPANTESTWSASPMSMDMDVDMNCLDFDDDLDLLPTPTSPPSSPFLDKLKLDLDTSSDDAFMFGDADVSIGYNQFHRHHQQAFPHPSPPPIHQIPHLHPLPTHRIPRLHELHLLPELDDIPTSPSSPALRSFASLPALSDDETLGRGLDFSLSSSDDELMFDCPPSQTPGPTLLALPGADTDAFLLPPDDTDLGVGSSSSSFLLPPDEPFGSSSGSGSLLLLDDVHPHRSPSSSPDSEPCDLYLEHELNLDIAHYANPEAHRLVALRRRLLESERIARAEEKALAERGPVHMRWEARRVRRRERERGKEVSEILRMKVFEKSIGKRNSESVKSGAVAEEQVEEEEIETGGEMEMDWEEEEAKEEEEAIATPRKKPSKRIRGVQSMDHLVAKMLLRRNDSDTHRSLARRRPLSLPLATGKVRTSSPLVRSASLPVNADVNEVHSCSWVADSLHSNMWREKAVIEGMGGCEGGEGGHGNGL